MYAGLAGLALLAGLFVLWPFMVSKSGRRPDSRKLNIELTRQRLAEMQREVAEGLIGRQDKDQLEQELKAALALEQDKADRPQSPSRWILLAGLLLAGVLSLYSYWQANEIGNLQHWRQANAQLAELGRRVVVEADPSVTAEELQQFALALRTKLKQQPQAPEGWLLLGRLHASLNRLDSAIEAYEKSLAQDPGRPGALLSISQALVMTGSEANLRRALGYLKRLQQIEPDNLSALGLTAIAATQLGSQELALDSWQQLAATLPEGDPMASMVAQRIAELTGTGQTRVLMTINLAEGLKSKLPEQGYLFLFAREAGSEMKMPAAVVRVPLSELPMELELTDANAMLGDYKLSSLTHAQLIARVSRDPNVETASGELQGETMVDISPGTLMQGQILIDKELNE
nr:c-type cytochrome biogenesis protein CcmI [Bowmanella dokdonensis]